jgi:hypothetical protein
MEGTLLLFYENKNDDEAELKDTFKILVGAELLSVMILQTVSYNKIKMEYYLCGERFPVVSRLTVYYHGVLLLLSFVVNFVSLCPIKQSPQHKG